MFMHPVDKGVGYLDERTSSVPLKLVSYGGRRASIRAELRSNKMKVTWPFKYNIRFRKLLGNNSRDCTIEMIILCFSCSTYFPQSLSSCLLSKDEQSISWCNPMYSFSVKITFTLFVWETRKLWFLPEFPRYLLFIFNGSLTVKCTYISPYYSGSNWAPRDFCILKHLLWILDTFWN